MSQRGAREFLAIFMFLTSLTTPGCDLLRKMHGRPEVPRSRATATKDTSSARVDTLPASDEPSRIVAPGIVEPWGGEVNLSPSESGWIAQIFVAEGQHVDRGQVLATLDDQKQQVAIELAQADLAEAEANVAKTVHGTSTEELRQGRAEAEVSEARSDLAKREAERSAHLGSESAVSPADVERAETEAKAAAANARRSAARLAELERGVRIEDRSAVRERLTAARARLRMAVLNLERRRVVAPAASTLLLSRFHVGEFFEVGSTPFFVLGDLSKLQVRLEVDEIDAFRTKEGLTCGIYGDDGAKISEATVFRLAWRMGRRGLPVDSPTARLDVRVREVFVELPGTEQLVPGRRVWGQITTSPARQ